MRKKVKQVAKSRPVHKKNRIKKQKLTAKIGRGELTASSDLNEYDFIVHELLKEQHTHQMSRNLLINNEKTIIRLQEQARILKNEQEKNDLVLKEYEKRFHEWEVERNILIKKEQKALCQLESCKQTMSFRLGYALIFGFKSFKGFKQLCKTVVQLANERKDKNKKFILPHYPTLNKPEINIKKHISAKPILQWKRLINGKEYQANFTKYPFTTNTLIQSELLVDKQGHSQLIDCAGRSQLVLNVNAYVKNEDFSDKQALLTIDYLDTFGNRLEPTIDLAFSKAKDRYYFYLNVDPMVEDQFLLVLPMGIAQVEIGVAAWDATAPIYIANEFHVSELEDGISVILPTYQGQNTIVQCLESLARQTLSYSLFEILVIVNGEQDDTPYIIEQFQKKNSKLNLKLFMLNEAGVSNARNFAIHAASRSFMTFIDDDDFVASGYLESLYSRALYNNLVLTGVEDIQHDMVLKSPVQDQLERAYQKGRYDYFDVTSVLTMNACKLAPAYMVKNVTYDTSLKSGEDVVFWSDLICQFSPKVVLVDNFEEANYKRVLSENSISRQPESYDFNVVQRLLVIKALLPIMHQATYQALSDFVQSKINAQAGFIQRYLKRRPDDYEKAILDIEKLAIDNEFIGAINSQFSKMLVISYCYAPYVDTSGIVMSKRLAAMRQPVDIISNNMDRVRTTDFYLNRIAGPYVGKQMVLNAPQAFSNWQAIEKFSELAILEVGKILSKRQTYESLYSRAMWPASHFAAVALKLKYPHMRWIAEFSDPILVDVTGNQRFEVLDVSWLEQHGLLKGDHTEINTNLFYWCEQLAYLFADEIIFTNENQKIYMLSYIKDDLLKDKVEQKSKIVPQPTLGREFYNLSMIEFEKKDHFIYFAYFGSFYVNRGFAPFLTAWLDLSDSIKNQIRLYIYTQQDSEEILKEVPEGLRKFVVIKPYVGYFDFLKLSDQFDGLLVMDCLTNNLKINNPYLPSKISDYLGSKSTVLIMAEEGSPMSFIESENVLKASIYDSDGIKNMINSLIFKIKRSNG